MAPLAVLEFAGYLATHCSYWHMSKKRFHRFLFVLGLFRPYLPCCVLVAGSVSLLGLSRLKVDVRGASVAIFFFIELLLPS